MRIMFWMVIAPELVLARAVRQWFAAREIRDAYNERQPGMLEQHHSKDSELIVLWG